jgi:uncharacterized membrane protein YbhN (UPF0104 family)
LADGSYDAKPSAQRPRPLQKSGRWTRVLQWCVTLVIVGFFSFAIYSVLPDILSYHWQFDPLWLLLALVLILVRGPIGAHGWWAIMRQLGYKLPWWRNLRIVYYSTLAGYVPGGMWHAVSRIYLADREGVPPVITGVGVVIESALVTLGAAMIAPLAALSWPEFPVWAVVGTLVVLCGFVLFPNFLFRLLDWLLVRFKREPAQVRMTPLDMLILLSPYALNWLLFGAMSFALVAALYPSLPLEQAPAVAGVHVTAWLLGYLAFFVPQGLVVREAVIVGFLAGVLGLPTPIATAAALLNRVWSMLGVGIWGAVASRVKPAPDNGVLNNESPPGQK